MKRHHIHGHRINVSKHYYKFKNYCIMLFDLNFRSFKLSFFLFFCFTFFFCTNTKKTSLWKCSNFGLKKRERKRKKDCNKIRRRSEGRIPFVLWKEKRKRKGRRQTCNLIHLKQVFVLFSSRTTYYLHRITKFVQSFNHKINYSLMGFCMNFVWQEKGWSRTEILREIFETWETYIN